MQPTLSHHPAHAEDAAMLRPTYSGDLHRPIFHFLPPSNWMNDPNGLIEWDGEVHLFYQYNPHGPWHERIHWGHATSRDLLHWRDQPIALSPQPDTYDNDGCWSGSAVNDGGTPTLLYTGVMPQVVNRAVSHDGLLTWQKDPANPVIGGAPEPIALQNGGHFRDPFVWREDNEWRMLIGTRTATGGILLLYRSDDLRAWESLGPFLSGEADAEELAWGGTMWECPNIVRFDSRSLVVLSPQATSSDLLEPVWHSGHVRDNHFDSLMRGVLVYGHIFYAPQLLRLRDGRTLMWGWLKEGRALDAGIAAGWNGVLSAPIEVSLDATGAPRLAPARELDALRRTHWRFDDVLPTAIPQLLDAVTGDALDLQVEVELEGDAQLDLLLRCSPTLEEQTVIAIGGAQQEIRIERTQSGGAAAHRSPAVAPLLSRTRATVRILLDRSTIELFTDEGRTALTTRIYPQQAESVHVGLRCQGGEARVKRLDIWRIASVWE